MSVYRLPVKIVTPQAGACINAWHIRAGAIASDEAADVAAAVAAIRTFYGAIAGWYPNGTAITADFAVNVETNSDRAVSWASLGSTSTSAAAPPHLSTVVGWKTSIRARRARGRTFLGPHVQACLDGDGTVANNFLAVVRPAAQALVDASVVDNGWAVGIWGLQDPAPKGFVAGGGDLSTLPHVARDITGFAVQDKFGIMRSRRP